MMIYFVLDPEKDCVKIGFSRSMRSRLSQLRCTVGRHIRVLAVMPGGEMDELAVHRLHREHHIEGEWFRYEQTLKEFIETRGLQWSGFDDLFDPDYPDSPHLTWGKAIMKSLPSEAFHWSKLKKRGSQTS
jgi:hypothetical protein